MFRESTKEHVGLGLVLSHVTKDKTKVASGHIPGNVLFIDHYTGQPSTDVPIDS